MNDRRLARVRRVRELQERALRVEWARAQGAASDADAYVLDVVRQRLEAETQMGARRGHGALDPRQVVSDEAALDRMGGVLAAARTSARAAHAVAESKREPWRARRAEAEGLVRLEERQRRRDAHARAVLEQAGMDEIASARHTRASLDERSDDR